MSCWRIACGLVLTSIIFLGVSLRSKVWKQVSLEEHMKMAPSDEWDKFSIFNVSTIKTTFRKGVNNTSDKCQGGTDEVTVVTMFFNIGSFPKGRKSNTRSPDTYYQWMKPYGRLVNPVVAFFDNATEKQYFQSIRQQRPTITKLVDRNQMWAFGLLKNISRIFNKPTYPRHYPNTVIPEYSCVMHAKYELMNVAVKANFFKTRYFAFADIGLFRRGPTEKGTFGICLPPQFNSSSIAYSAVSTRIADYKPDKIIAKNVVWACGGFFIGELNVMLEWTKEYMKGTEDIMKEYDLMSTDQQVVYILHNSGKLANIQTYGRHNDWFYLSNICREQCMKTKCALFNNANQIDN